MALDGAVLLVSTFADFVGVLFGIGIVIVVAGLLLLGLQMGAGSGRRQRRRRRGSWFPPDDGLGDSGLTSDIHIGDGHDGGSL